MSSSYVDPNDPRMDRIATIIEVDDEIDPDDPAYKPRRKMKLGDALKEIDNSKHFSFCTCSHDIDEHEGVEDYRERYAGKCNHMDGSIAVNTQSFCKCKQYRYSGIVKTAKELGIKSGENPVYRWTNTHPTD